MAGDNEKVRSKRVGPLTPPSLPSPAAGGGWGERGETLVGWQGGDDLDPVVDAEKLGDRFAIT